MTCFSPSRTKLNLSEFILPNFLVFFLFGVSLLKKNTVFGESHSLYFPRAFPTIISTANSAPQSLLPKTPDGPLGRVTWRRTALKAWSLFESIWI